MNIDETINDLILFTSGKKYHTVYADPPWQFSNKTGKVSPEHKRLNRYQTMSVNDIVTLPVKDITCDEAHLYLWVPNALLPDGLKVLNAWGFTYKSNLIWEKVRKDGEPDGRGVGFYFRNVTEILLFGVRTKKKNATFRTLEAGRSQVNLIRSQKQEHSRKPEEFVSLIERCSPGPYVELFARGKRQNWDMWGKQAHESYEPTWSTYKNHTVNKARELQLRLV